ncbi:L-sulfolactate dehydrogenase, partial [Frankliniella fusca]
MFAMSIKCEMISKPVVSIRTFSTSMHKCSKNRKSRLIYTMTIVTVPSVAAQRDKTCVDWCSEDLIRTAQWLQLSGTDHLTPKRVTAFNCFICSCHFLNGKENGPIEYIEECNFDGPEELQAEVDQNVEAVRKRTQIYRTGSMESPPIKNRRVEELTPSSKVAIDALMSLTNTLESPAERKVTPTNFTYSPRRQLWRLRGNYARNSARKTLHVMMDSAKTQEQETFSEFCHDLGVAPLLSPSHNSSFALSDDNNNIILDEKQKLFPSQYSSQQSLESEITSCMPSQYYLPPPTARGRSVSPTNYSPQVNAYIQ